MMPRESNHRDLHSHILTVMKETRQDDPFAAIRAKARSLLGQFHDIFGGEPPFDLDALASFRDLHHSTETPRHSRDSEIAPQRDGRVVLRVNRDRPLTRQRFSIGHEVGHTLFPEYQLAVRCRKGIDRDWADPDDLLEILCDVAASEFLFPDPWFSGRVQEMTMAARNVATLAGDYQASRDATVRRLVEVHADPLAAVFFSWKLKPVEIRTQARDRRQRRIFPNDQRSAPTPKLRVDYAIINDAFARSCCNHIPKDKSVPSDGPIHLASTTGEPHDGAGRLELGSATARFAIHALPVYTPECAAGPDGAASVVAILKPL